MILIRALGSGDVLRSEISWEELEGCHINYTTPMKMFI